jgi:hypothetical protein
MDDAIERIADEADVSSIASALAYQPVAPPGWIWAYVRDDTGVVEHSGRSTGTVAKRPKKDQLLNIDYAHRFADYQGTFQRGWHTIYVLHYPTTLDQAPDDRTASALLKAIGDDLAANYDAATVLKMKQWASGETATAEHSYTGTDASELAANMQSRFAHRADLADFASHDLFEAYVGRRAYELLDRRND